MTNKRRCDESQAWHRTEKGIRQADPGHEETSPAARPQRNHRDRHWYCGLRRVARIERHRSFLITGAPLNTSVIEDTYSQYGAWWGMPSHTVCAEFPTHDAATVRHALPSRCFLAEPCVPSHFPLYSAPARNHDRPGPSSQQIPNVDESWVVIPGRRLTPRVRFIRIMNFRHVVPFFHCGIIFREASRAARVAKSPTHLRFWRYR